MITIKQKHKNNKNVLNNDKTPRLKRNPPPKINKILKTICIQTKILYKQLISVKETFKSSLS